MDVGAEHRRQQTRFLQYDGTIGELYPIFLLNLLLTVVTLGIWRFWAVTRMRRYVSSRTSHDAQRFDYDGTGGQLFVGFLIATGIIVGLYVAAIVLMLVLGSISKLLVILPMLGLLFAILVLALGAPFSAQRYRLNHTLWRGIRGGMEGSMIRYGLWSALYLAASVLTFYQLLPWMRLRLYQRRVNASFFGSQRLHAEGRAMPLYLAWLATFAGLLALLVVVFSVLWAFESDKIRLFLAMQGTAMANAMLAALMPALLLAYLVLFVGGALISCAFEAVFIRHAVGHTTLGGVRFGSDVGALTILGLVALNFVILVGTLGLGLPVIIHRNQRFLTTHLLSSGTLDLSALQQSTQAPSRFGEGMFQALDAGAGLG